MDPNNSKKPVDDQAKKATLVPNESKKTNATIPAASTMTDYDAMIDHDTHNHFDTKSSSIDSTRQNKILLNEERSAADDINLIPDSTSETATNLFSAPSLNASKMHAQEPRQSEQTTPGAVRVSGINRQQRQQESQLSIFSSADNLQVEEEKSADEPAKITSSRLVAEVVDEDELLHELLSRRITSDADEHSLLQEMLSRRPPDVVAESVVSVSVVEPTVDYDMDQDDDDSEKEKGCKRNPQIIIVGCVFVAVGIVIAAVVVGVLLSRSKRPKRMSHPASLPTPLPSQKPTLAPVSRLEAFRTLLVNHSVTSAEALDQVNGAQRSALNWIATRDQAMLNVTSIETDVQIIINRYVMGVMYAANGGKLRSNESHFLSPSSICDWHTDSFHTTGVFCSSITPPAAASASQVLALVLEGNSLSGSIPTELGKLVVLVHLDLAFNDFYTTIPSELGQLGFLTHLTLNGNELTGTIPTQLGQLLSLTNLVLDSNQLTGTIPTQFGQLSGLTSLLLNENQIKGTIPTELGLLSSLTSLSLSYNALSGTPPSVLGMLLNLTSLHLDNNNFTGNLSAIFCHRSTLLSEFFADCLEKVECSCCTECL